MYAALYYKRVPVARNPFVKLDFYYVLRLGSLRAFNDIKTDRLPLSEGLEAVALNGGIVNKYISALFLCQKSEPFGFIKPLNSPFCHDAAPPNNC